MICRFIKTYGSATRKDIDGLIANKLPAFLTDKQKKVKVNNLINTMANKSRTINNTGSCRNSVWVLKD